MGDPMDKTEMAKRIIEEVMGKKEFQTQKTQEIPWLLKIIQKLLEILGKILDFIGNLIGKLLSRLNLNFGQGTGTAMSFWIKIIGLIIGLALSTLIIYLLIKIILKYAKARKKDLEIGDELEEFLKEPEKPISLAYKYMEEGEYRLSFRYFFLALLIEANKHEYIIIDRHKTNRDYLEEIVRKDMLLGKEISPFFDNFYLIWYGKRPINNKDLLGWEETYKGLIDRLGGNIVG